MVVFGVVVALVGLAGLTGRPDRSRLRLYQHRTGHDVPPTQHRVLQRVGGGAAVVGGIWFVVAGLT